MLFHQSVSSECHAAMHVCLRAVTSVCVTNTLVVAVHCYICSLTSHLLSHSLSHSLTHSPTHSLYSIFPSPCLMLGPHWIRCTTNGVHTALQTKATAIYVLSELRFLCPHRKNVRSHCEGTYTPSRVYQRKTTTIVTLYIKT